MGIEITWKGKGWETMEKDRNDFEKIEQIKRHYEEVEMSKEQVEAMKKSIQDAKTEKKKQKKNYGAKAGVAAAAAAALFVLLPNTSENVAYAMSSIPLVGKLVEVVTFRDYQYESERQSADVTVPQLVAEDVIPNGTEAADGNGQTAAGENGALGENGQRGKEEQQIQENLKKTTEEINAEIQEITDRIVAEFEENLETEGNYQDIVIKHEVLATSEDYFTLKLICYQGAGSGAEWDYFYTIDLTNGERLALADLFAEGADYITPISENIKEQMRAQMSADENVIYWLDNEDIPEWNFEKITEETSFYLNQNGNIVICFNEGDVAPMYMGCVEFEIPDDVVGGIRK